MREDQLPRRMIFGKPETVVGAWVPELAAWNGEGGKVRVNGHAAGCGMIKGTARYHDILEAVEMVVVGEGVDDCAKRSATLAPDNRVEAVKVVILG